MNIEVTEGNQAIEIVRSWLIDQQVLHGPLIGVSEAVLSGERTWLVCFEVVKKKRDYDLGIMAIKVRVSPETGMPSLMMSL